MTKKEKIDAKTTTIGMLFSQQFFFRIPDYQRPFSWDKDQFDDLIDDLLGADRTQEYFFGTMVLHHHEEHGLFDVVDGQQRLTSLMILLACLRDLVEDEEFKSSLQDKILQKKNKADSIPEKVRLEVKDRAKFAEIVVKLRGTAAVHDPTGWAAQERRYLQAVGIFRSKLQGLSQEELGEMITFISQKCVVVYFAASAFEDAFRLFTIVNDRGKQLRRIDILKAVNIAPRIITKDSVRSRLAQQWEEIEKDLGESTFESIFYLVRFILLKDKPQADLLKEFQGRILGKLLVKGEPFFDLIFKYAGLYESIFIDREMLPEDSPELKRYKALIYIMDSEFEASEWRACLLSYANKFGAEGFYQFCLTIEKVYLQQWVKGIRKDERSSDYSRILTLIETAKTGKDVQAGITYDAKSIQDAAGQPNVYSAGFGKYFLLRLELLATEHDLLREFDAKSVEHVLPQDPEKTGYWAKHHDLSKIDEYVNSVGNLVLLSKSKNSSARNFDFEKKKQKYLKNRVSDYPRSIQVLEYKDWDRPTIEKRTQEAQKLILQDP